DILAACSHITKLSICLTDNVNFDAIAASFPSLETLSCSEMNHFYGLLRDLNHLQILWVNAWGDNVPTALSWLPLRSAEMLSALNLNCGGVDVPIFDTDSLDAFVNLKSLTIGPLCDSICDFIIRAQIQLEV